jgi:hypothetical protein
LTSDGLWLVDTRHGPGSPGPEAADRTPQPGLSRSGTHGVRVLLRVLFLRRLVGQCGRGPGRGARALVGL